MNDHIEPHKITWGRFLCFLFGHPQDKRGQGEYIGSIPRPDGSDPTEIPQLLFSRCGRCGEILMMKVWQYKPFTFGEATESMNKAGKYD